MGSAFRISVNYSRIFDPTWSHTLPIPSYIFAKDSASPAPGFKSKRHHKVGDMTRLTRWRGPSSPAQTFKKDGYDPRDQVRCMAALFDLRVHSPASGPHSNPRTPAMQLSPLWPIPQGPTSRWHVSQLWWDGRWSVQSVMWHVGGKRRERERDGIDFRFNFMKKKKKNPPVLFTRFQTILLILMLRVQGSSSQLLNPKNIVSSIGYPNGERVHDGHQSPEVVASKWPACSAWCHIYSWDLAS